MVSQIVGHPLKLITHIAKSLNLLRIRTQRELRNISEVSEGGTILAGEPLAGGDRVSILFVGTKPVLADLQLWFKGEPEQTAVALDSVNDVIARKDVDGVVLEDSFFADHLYSDVLRGREGRYFQSLVDLEIRCSTDFETFLSEQIGKRKRKHIRRALKLPMTFRVSRSLADLACFYEEILVPSTKDRHGERSHLPSLTDFSYGMSAPLMHICEQAGKPLVVNFMLMDKKTGRARLWRQGLAGEVREDRKLKTDATMFCDAGTIKYCFEQGYQVVSFGKSACLEADGGFWNKSSWGCEPQIDNYYPFCYLYCLTPAMTTASQEMGFTDVLAINQMAASALADGEQAAVEKNSAQSAANGAKAS